MDLLYRKKGRGTRGTERERAAAKGNSQSESTGNQ